MPSPIFRTWRFVLALCMFVFSSFYLSASHSDFFSESFEFLTELSVQDHQEHVIESSGADATEDHAVHLEEGGGHHGPDTSSLFFIILAVFIGAATRHFLKKIPVPFTALLLIIGIVLGVMNRMDFFMHWGSVDVSFIHDSFIWAAHIDPHMLFFVFLPILIFEAAFAMDLHTFKKSAANSVILAVPGILMALILTGVLVYAIDILDIGLEGWANWSLAFMFGSVISATDPVAVVALLKDLGASKKLGTLIEGESLLNDGTAIVLFMVFFLGISGEASDKNGFVEFLRVALGGVGVGLFFGWIVLRWLKKVLALVALGLLVGGFGRSNISPQVEHFMHEFWELAGFIANCLIFLIVGFVIAERTEFSANDFFSLAIIYVGIHIVRALVMLLHYPFMKNTGYGLPVKDAIVVWYGALRGAIGLALALMVAGVDSNNMAKSMDITPDQASAIKDQFLFLIAGTVTLTLLVNATTIKMLIQKLGLLDLPPAKALMIKSSSEYMLSSAESHVQKLKSDRQYRKVNWSTVAEYLPKEIALVQDIDESMLEVAKMAEHRTRILEKEKSSYWRQFKAGTLGSDAVHTLTDTVNEILDIKGETSLSARMALEELWKPAKWLSVTQSWPIIGRITENTFFDRLAVSYDCAAGFVAAQEDCLKLLESIYRAEAEEERKNLEIIETEINENIISGQTFMRNLRNTYPEIYRSISTRQAIRSVLNYELHTVERLKGKGRLNNSEVSRMISDIETRMKKLMEKPPSIQLPDTTELIHSISWLKNLSKENQKLINDACQTKIYSTGQRIVKNIKPSDGLYIIARGTVHVVDGDRSLEVLGKGDAIGEITYFTKEESEFNVVAESPTTILWVSLGNLDRMIASEPELKSMLEKHACGRLAVRLLSTNEKYRHMDDRQLRNAGEKGAMIALKKGKEYSVSEGKTSVFISGKVVSSQNDKLVVSSPKALTFKEVKALQDSWIIEI